MSDLRHQLEQGAAKLGLQLNADQFDKLMGFLELLQKWNKVYNLTSVRDPQEMMSLHMLDSLAAVPALSRHVASLGKTAGQKVSQLDVGSGGGLPGVVFAVCCPEVDVHCVDTVGKKAAFLQQVAVALKLPNLKGIHARVETLKGPYEIVSCRAFASLLDFTTWSRSAIAENGVWFAMKGKHPQDEIDALGGNVKVFHVEPLSVPGLSAERCIVWAKPIAETV
ncbi:MAG TPA: 16S rRNA (guanine(527)-N(7))-methyltransferase RsmG [Comamonas sp.]